MKNMFKMGKSCFAARPIALLLATLGFSAPTHAEVTRFYELEGFGVLLNGNPESTALSENGAITLAPKSREWYSDPEAVFSAATAYRDGVALARVDTQSVVYIDASGKETTLLEVDEAMVTVLAVHGDDLYVASGPPAQIQRVSQNGNISVFYEAEAGYIWDMAFDAEGELLLATGEPGTVTKVSSKSKGEAIFLAEQKHMRSLVLDEKLGLFAGGGERGIVYRQEAGQDEFVALFDTRLPEVVDIVTLDSKVYAASVKGATALVQGGKPKVEVRSQLWEIDMLGTGQVMAGSNDEAIFDLAVDRHGQVLACTGATGRDDPRGRIYAVSPSERLVSLIYQSPSKRITHMVELGNGRFISVAGAGGRLAAVGGEYQNEGEFFTAPFDAKFNAAYGTLNIFGRTPSGTGASAAIRTGQTATPDESWTKWSREIGMEGGQAKSKLSGRYMQVRITLEGSADKSPAIHRLQVAFLRQNLPPFVKEIVALRKGIALLPVERGKSESKVVTLGDKIPDVSRANTDKSRHRQKKPPEARQVIREGALTLRWVADDPNGDALSYDIAVRESGTTDWRTLNEGSGAPYFTMNSTQLPDGHYEFRVQATDAPSNPAGTEQLDTRESRTVLVDNTPPKVDDIDIDEDDDRYVATASVIDHIGPLTEAVYSLNGAPFKRAQSEDGILDGPADNLVMPLGNLVPGQYHLMIRVRDDAENRGLGELRFTVK